MKGQAELREAGAKVQLSQSERALFPVPEMDAAAQSMGNWTGSKERATFKAPSDTGGLDVVCSLSLVPEGGETACGGVTVFAFP